MRAALVEQTGSTMPRDQVFWVGIRDYAGSIFTRPKFGCGIIWNHPHEIEPTFYIQEGGNDIYLLFTSDGGPVKVTYEDPSDEEASCLQVCTFAIEHRKEFIDKTIEGIEAFDEYIQYCAYSFTGGYTKSATKN